MLPWLAEHIETIAFIGLLVVVGVLNCFSKPEPKRDLKSPEYKSLDTRFKDAYRRAIFGDDADE